jgi:hypothetical protein
LNKQPFITTYVQAMNAEREPHTESEVRQCRVSQVSPLTAEIILARQFGDKLQPKKGNIKRPPNLGGELLGRPHGERLVNRV